MTKEELQRQYRIISNGYLFRVQRRWWGIWWTQEFFYPECSTVASFNTKKEAQEFIDGLIRGELTYKTPFAPVK